MHQRCRILWLLVACLICGGCEIRDAADPPNADQGSPLTGNEAGRAPDGLAADHISFVQGFERGWKASRAQQKPLLLFFTAEWCKYCHQMANETFTQEAVVRLSQKFVCVLIDADAEREVCRDFEVHRFPTVQFVSPSGAPLNRVVGKQPANQLVAQMNAALNTIARRPELTVVR